MGANVEIREEIRRRRVKMWEVAREIGVCPETLTRWMRTELAPEQKAKVLDAIDKVLA